MKVFNLPDLGEGLPDAAIVKWHVNVGEQIAVDQLLVSVETAKAIVDIPSPQSGIIEQLCANIGDVVSTGKPLVLFKSEPDSEVKTVTKAETTTVKATPAVRTLAKNLNLDLSTIKPTGPNNTITMEDLKNNKNSEHSPQWKPIDHVVRTMALAMQKSLLEVVPATIFEDLILPEVLNLDLTVSLMQAIAFASNIEPVINSWLKKDHNNNFQQKIFTAVNLGIAVDSKEGLFVPVIKDIANKSAEHLRTELNILRKHIDERTVPLEKLQDPTFILSNFGKFTGRYATPVILPPTVAILAVGKLRQQMVVVDGVAVIKHCLPLSLTFDHRVVTGGQAARFLAAILRFFS